MGLGAHPCAGCPTGNYWKIQVIFAGSFSDLALSPLKPTSPVPGRQGLPDPHTLNPSLPGFLRYAQRARGTSTACLRLALTLERFLFLLSVLSPFGLVALRGAIGLVGMVVVGAWKGMGVQALGCVLNTWLGGGAAWHAVRHRVCQSRQGVKPSQSKQTTYSKTGAASRQSKSLSPAERSEGIQGERDLGCEGLEVPFARNGRVDGVRVAEVVRGQWWHIPIGDDAHRSVHSTLPYPMHLHSRYKSLWGEAAPMPLIPSSPPPPMRFLPVRYLPK